MTRRSLAPLFLLSLTLPSASCDHGSFRDCAVACTASTGCPDGLACGTEGLCRTGVTASTCNTVQDAVDADTSCVCSTAETLSCSSGDTVCSLGCAEEGAAHCRAVAPSNGLALGPLDMLDTVITIDDVATFDTDTGAITGGLTRSAGTGIRDGIAFATTGMIGVFTIHQLTVSSFGTVKFKGARAAAFVVETTALIEGEIDGTAGCSFGEPPCAGPGGGNGAVVSPATGCGPGGDGVGGGSNSDPGGGGGGSRRAGAPGGADTMSTPGLGGIACMSPMAEPLIGGSGGGTGSPGGSPTFAQAGGGGGAFQLTALEKITVAGTINMGGAGGGGGPGAAAGRGGGGGGGGGAGGAILLEAPIVIVDGILAANGGGGGSAGNGTTVGLPGATGRAGTTPAAGGVDSFSSGGNGGAGTTMPGSGQATTGSVNGGGGGGGVGAIYVRTVTPPTLTGSIVSPPLGMGALRTE